MSTTDVETTLHQVLRTPDPETICFFGQWGTGKTYLWDQVIGAIPISELGLKRYAYVSLFGVNNLNDLKKEIFFKTVSLEDGATLGAQPDLLTRAGKRLSELVAKLPEVTKYSDVAMSMLMGTIQDQIICLDDIERRGGDLGLREIFGLVSFLRDQRQCKIIVILNRDALRPEDREEFNRMVEKTFDFELRFDPAPAECAQIAFSATDDVTQRLKRHCVTLGISNIRVLRRIWRVAKIIDARLERFDPAVRNQALHGVPLFCWSRFEPDVAPSAEFIRSRNRFEEREKAASENDRNWNALLDRYDFYACDEFDACLLQLIHLGAFNDPQLDSEAQKLAERLQQTDARAAEENAWRMYHETFDDNEEALASAFVDVVQKFAPHVSPTNLNGMVRLLRRVGRTTEPAKLIAEYVRQNAAANPKNLDLASYAFRADVTDAEFKDALNTAFAAVTNAEPLAPILARLREGVVRHKDAAVLSKLTHIEFLQIFTDDGQEKLSTLIDTILSYPGDDAAIVDMKHAARTALRSLAQRSKLNQARIEQLGLDLSDGAPS